MYLQKFIFIAVCVLYVGFAGPGFSGPDSLKVRVVNTSQTVGDLRYIERDSSNLILRVLDAQGEAFRELEKNQVEVWRGSAPAKILAVQSLDKIIGKNVYVMLALDNSASMSGSRRDLLRSVQQLFQMLKGKSEISIALFDEDTYRPKASRPKLEDKPVNVAVLNFSADLDAQLENIRWNYEHALTSKTYLHDEVLVALQEIGKIPENRLRILVLLSDGRDLGSRFGFDRVLEEAKKTGVRIYGIDYSRLPKIDSNMQQLVDAVPHGKAYKAKNSSDLIPVFEALTREIINEFQVTYHFPVPPSGEINSTSDNLTITTRQITDEFPMLNYVFFDSNSAAIHPRYLTLDSPEKASEFNETQIRKSLDKYYHLLNIIGQRAQQNPGATLTLTGCNMAVGAEKNNLELSRQRAEAIKAYLQDIWGISAERISVDPRQLPQKASGTRTPAGQAENRRVEITSNEPGLLRPIRSEVSELVFAPEIGQFQLQIKAPEGLKQWKFQANSPAGILFTKTFDEPKTDLTWNWLNLQGEKISQLDQISYSLEITDLDGASFTSAPKILPVTEITAINPKNEVQADSSFEKFSLILFDFNSSQLSGRNEMLMGKVLELYQAHPDAKLRVMGYCDDIGSEDYNLKLSTQRAKMAYTSLQRMKIPGNRLAYLGYGEINPIFSNDSPEGRFLNRTVQILISYPVQVAEK